MGIEVVRTVYSIVQNKWVTDPGKLAVALSKTRGKSCKEKGATNALKMVIRKAIQSTICSFA
jgi:hypothetical protein